MPETTKGGNTETATAEETFMNEDQDKANAEHAEVEKDDETIKPVGGIKRLLVWTALIVGSWALVLGIAYLVYSGLKSDRQVAPAASVVVSDDGRTVTVPAVRGVNAADCRPEELAVEGNRLVFKNGCAKPVFYDQEQ